MQEYRQEQIAQYVVGYTGSYSERTLTTWITHGVGYFDALGITWPNDTDYQGLKAEMLATLPGVRRETLIGLKQAGKRVVETQKFYEWLKQQEGKKQMSLFEETEPEVIEPVSSESVAVQEVTTEENTVSLSMDAVEPVNDTPVQHKRGRKPKAATEKRTVKLSIYLTPSLYSALDDLAHYDQREISDVIYGLIEDFTERNAEQLLDYRSFLARRKAIR